MSSGRVLALARHEYRAAWRSRILLTLVAILAATTFVSVLTAALDYRGQLADYQAYVQAATAGGVTRIPPSPLALLSLLRGAMEYVEILGAVIAVALGYLTISRERANGTMPLLRSRPVTPGEQAVGSALGALAVLSTLVASTAVVAVLCLGVIGRDWLSWGQGLQLLVAYLAAIVYMGVFYAVGVVATARSRVATTGLMVALGIWLLVVLIIPQIGDTLDADNQVPGGLFAALGLDRNGETAVLAHFSGYEHVRNWIEEASVSKHFERFAFAMTDVKDKYRGFTLGQLLTEKRNDIGWLAFYATALGTALWRSFRRVPPTPQGGTA